MICRVTFSYSWISKIRVKDAMIYLSVIMVFLFLGVAQGFEIVAHKGLHQPYDVTVLDGKVCSARAIQKTGHANMENTIESIEAAFLENASMVEVDIQPTLEGKGKLDNLVIFHDFALGCRSGVRCGSECNCNSDGKCVTSQQTLNFLRSLDIGYGYTYDGGQSYPFRGLFKGRISTFVEVLELLKKYPSKKILIDLKGERERTGKAFLRIVSKYPISIRKRLYYPYRYGFKAELKRISVKNGIIQLHRKCLIEYFLIGWTGWFPKSCRRKKIAIPLQKTLERLFGLPGKYFPFTSIIWGWPHKFLKLAKEYGTGVYVRQVETIEMYNKVITLPIKGIMTSNIDLIGPYHHQRNNLTN